MVMVDGPDSPATLHKSKGRMRPACDDDAPRDSKRLACREASSDCEDFEQDKENHYEDDDTCDNIEPELQDVESFDVIPSQNLETSTVVETFVVKRISVIPSLLSVSEVETVLRGAFKAPRGSDSRQLRGVASSECAQDNRKKRLGVRLPPSAFGIKPGGNVLVRQVQEPELVLPLGNFSEEDLALEPLVLWDGELDVPDTELDGGAANIDPLPTLEKIRKEADHAFTVKTAHVLQEYKQLKGIRSSAVVIEPFLCKFLREHQRQGVQFMFECVIGQRGFDGMGCILADDMGLGKTFQSITLLWTLLTQGINGQPTIRRAAVVCPTSLVKNWAKEIVKWLGDRLDGGVLALSESSRENVVEAICKYTRQGVYAREPKFPPVLIISYETFRIHAARLVKNGPELLICDEAHRLKNDKTLTNQALASLPCRRRVLLSGTPMQNDLEEFFAMVDFTNPGVLGTAAHFRKAYQNPILAGREPDATDAQRDKGNQAQAALSALVNSFILRRTNELLSKHLPPKVVQIVCCRLSPMQLAIYRTICQSKEIARLCRAAAAAAAGGGGAAPAAVSGPGGRRVLASITALKKLCNHPRLIYDAIRANHAAAQSGGAPPADAAGLDECAVHFPPELFAAARGGGGRPEPHSELSGKMGVLERMLCILYHEKKERVVLISNYTQTLDVFQAICRHHGFPFLRLDGSTGVGKRQKLVDVFNDPRAHQFAFLLSSKAGGCGLNLVGASRLVLFDPDWNPANDKQAAARIWRDGQCRRVYEYRFFSTGSIEEKVYQRQLSKEGLQGGLFDAELQMQSVSTEDLRDLFTLREDTASDTYDSLGRPPGAPLNARQEGFPGQEDLGRWAHCAGTAGLEDDVLRRAGEGVVSFVFSCDVEGNEAKLRGAGAGAPAPANK